MRAKGPGFWAWVAQTRVGPSRGRNVKGGGKLTKKEHSSQKRGLFVHLPRLDTNSPGERVSARGRRRKIEGKLEKGAKVYGGKKG